MVHRQVIAVCLLGIASLSGALQTQERLSWSAVPEATKSRIATLIARMDRCVVPGSPAEWNPNEVPGMYWYVRRDPHRPRVGEARFPRYTVFMTEDLTRILQVVHRDAYDANGPRIAIITPEQAGERAIALLREEGRTEELSVGTAKQLGNKYTVTIEVRQDGVPFADFSGSCMMLVDARTGRVSMYEPSSGPPRVEGPRSASVAPEAAQIEAGLALGGRRDGRSWIVRQATLKWSRPYWPEPLPGRRSEEDDAARRGVCRLYFEVFAVATTGEIRENASGAIIYVDPVTGRAVGMMSLETMGGVEPSRMPMRFSAGEATLAVGATRTTVRDAAIFWTPAWASVRGVQVALASPGMALSLDYDPQRGVVVDPRTGRVGVPSKPLAAVLRELATGAPQGR